MTDAKSRALEALEKAFIIDAGGNEVYAKDLFTDEELHTIRAALRQPRAVTVEEIGDALEYAAMEYHNTEEKKPRTEQKHPFNFYAEYLHKHFRITKTTPPTPEKE